MVGGVSGLVATIMLKPRIGRFGENAEKPAMCNPANAIVGMFMLWYVFARLSTILFACSLHNGTR